MWYNVPMNIERLGKGYVNDTFLVKNTDGTPAYVLQRINTVAFQKVESLMDNILKVSSYIKSQGGKTLDFLPFEDGQYLKVDKEGTWRKMAYIPSYSTDQPDDFKLIEGGGIAFGSFLKNIQGFSGNLFETIPEFHNTIKRLSDCLTAADKDEFNRADTTKDLLLEIEKRFNKISNDYKTLLSCGPERITHNDTKISNVLFDLDSHKPICVVDLDTVMMGMTLYDFGDAARSIALEASSSDELKFNQDKYNCFKNAYLKNTENILTKDEIENLMLATITISTELGVRFLEDYLNGDKYFNISSSNDNLQKARKLLTYTFKLN